MKSRARDALLRRAERAEELATIAISAEPLRFAAGLYRAQAETSERLRDLSGELEADLPKVVTASRELVRFIAARAPAALAEEAARAVELEAQLLALFHGRASLETRDFLSRALLRPYLETMAAEGRALTRRSAGACPFCGGPPWIAARRATAESDGATRLLGCAWCATEWVVPRILCPACGESDPVKLPGFRSDTFASVRIEACESCRGYVKSIDLTQDARPIPEVDDLLSLSLDLWARERGFVRVEPGLAGI